MLVELGCFACWCPCIVYAKLQSRLSFLERNNYPHPDGGSGCNSDCFVHCCLTSLCGVGWALQVCCRALFPASPTLTSRLFFLIFSKQIGQRSTIRDRYRISGNGCGDCMSAWCCTPCTLTQESREVALEERVLGGNERAMQLD